MNSYEVVFEVDNRGAAISILGEIFAKAKNVGEINSTFETTQLSSQSFNSASLNSLLSLDGDGCITIKLINVMILEVTIPMLLLRCVKYANQFDVDFSFDLDPAADALVFFTMRNLHSFAIDVANRINIKDFFGGLEPASDIETRYFTNLETGPLPEEQQSETDPEVSPQNHLN